MLYPVDRANALSPHSASPLSLLPRPHLDSLLIDAFHKPLTTVIAGAGFGKTSAVASALESVSESASDALSGKFVWLSLSELDNLSGILWRRLTSAAEVHHRQLAADLIKLGYPSAPAPFDQMLRMIGAALDAPDEQPEGGRFLLVLDDFHCIRDHGVLSFFERLIAARVPNLSIVILSRERPRLPLASMLAKGFVSRITEDELRFSLDETRAYYQMLGVPLDGHDDAVAELHARTEGWGIAICLVGLALLRNPASDPALALRANVDISMLIDEEIFGRCSPVLQRFLVALSLLDDPPADLLRELATEIAADLAAPALVALGPGDARAPDAPRLLDELAHSSQLIRYDQPLGRYHMNHIFRDFLRARRSLLPQPMVCRTHLTAARWFRAHGQLEEALDHFRACDAFGEMFDAILSVRGRVAQDVADAFVAMIDAAPPDAVAARPIIRAAKALYLMNNNHIDEAHALLTALMAEFDAPPRTKARRAIVGEACVLLGLISIIRQNLEFVELFRRADRCLPGGSALIDQNYNIAEGVNVVGIKDAVPGALSRYQDALFTAAPHAARAMNGCGFGMEYLCAADAALMTGNLHDAEKHAYQAIFHARSRGQHTIEYMANFYLIRAFIYKGNYGGIAALLSQMHDELAQPPNADCITTFDIIEGWFFVKTGRTAQVAKWILHERETRKLLAPVVVGREYLVRSDWLLATDRHHELLGFMKQSDVFYERRGILYALIQNKITEAIIHHYLGDHGESMRALEAAYALSSPNELVFQYIEYGSRMRTVLQAALQDGSVSIPRPWLENVQTKSSTYAKRLAQVVKACGADGARDEPQIRLSKREQEVLSCLCHGFTRDEIADSCNLSPNTVRSVLQSVFLKLGAQNALDAVRIATIQNLA